MVNTKGNYFEIQCAMSLNLIILSFFVDTTKAIEINPKSSTDCSWAIVNIATENAKYCDLKSINVHKLNINR